MKIHLDNNDMAYIIEQIKEDSGAYLAGCQAETRCKKLPWVGQGVFTEAIFR